MAKHIVKCAICNESFDANSVPFVKVNSRRYAHKSCAEAKQVELTQTELDKEELLEYIKKLLSIEYITPRIHKQLNQYVEEYHYTYSGMRKALIYFYEIKGNDVEKANGGIGIIPYVYDSAYRYYYELWLAQERNRGKEIVNYKPDVVIINIPRPEKKVKKRKLFSFLDMEGEE